MGKSRQVWARHPLWSVFLLMAADADKTGLSADGAKAELKRLMPSIADDLDGILAAQGDLDRMNGESEVRTALAITTEAHAMGVELPQTRGGAQTERPEDSPAPSFTDTLRSELRTPRNRRIVVPNGDGEGAP